MLPSGPLAVSAVGDRLLCLFREEGDGLVESLVAPGWRVGWLRPNGRQAQTFTRVGNHDFFWFGGAGALSLTGTNNSFAALIIEDGTKLAARMRRLALHGAERTEVVLAQQRLRRGVHRTGIERARWSGLGRRHPDHHPLAEAEVLHGARRIAVEEGRVSDGAAHDDALAMREEIRAHVKRETM